MEYTLDLGRMVSALKKADSESSVPKFIETEGEKYIYDNNNGLSKTQDWRKQSMGEHPAKSCVFLYGGFFLFSSANCDMSRYQ